MGFTIAGRVLTLGEKRQQAADLQAQGLSYAQIGRAMNVTAVKARDLCLQHKRFSGLEAPASFRFELSQRAILALATGRRAAQLGNTMAERFERLLHIALAYSRTELLAEQLVGERTCREIEVWLASKGLTFRSPETVLPETRSSDTPSSSARPSLSSGLQ